MRRQGTHDKVSMRMGLCRGDTVEPENTEKAGMLTKDLARRPSGYGGNISGYTGKPR